MGPWDRAASSSRAPGLGVSINLPGETRRDPVVAPLGRSRWLRARTRRDAATSDAVLSAKPPPASDRSGDGNRCENDFSDGSTALNALKGVSLGVRSNLYRFFKASWI